LEKPVQQRRDPRVVQGTHHVVNYTLSTAEISFMTACRAAGDDPLKTASGTFIALIVLLAFQTFAAADAAKRVDIITMVDTPQLLEVLDGIRQGLHDHGYVDGADIKIDFKSAQGNFGTAQQIVRQYIGDQPDVIVTITTPTSQAAVAATKDIPIIFTTVTDPQKAKLVPALKHPGGNVSGISDLVPAERQLDAVKALVPNLKRLGFVYDPSLPNAVSTVESMKALAQEKGFTTVDSAAMGLNNVPAAGQALVGKVDAVFVPNDTTVYAAFEALVKICQEAKLPLFSAERRSVQRGAIATVGFDFKQMGVKTADMVDKVLKGTKAGDMDVVFMEDEPGSLGLYINKASAEKMGVTISPEMLDKAAHVY
jgi:putative ABC transport system substrate-binding protein